MARIKTRSGRKVKGDYARGYKPSMLDEAWNQATGRYPSSRSTTVKTKGGKHYTGKRW